MVNVGGGWNEMSVLGQMEPIRELVYRHLRERIVGGRFDYGTRLKETDVARDLGVSRTPVREAFRKLELEGLVRALNRKGVVVTNLEAADLNEIYALREVLEGLAARLGAVNRTDAQIREFARLADLMERAFHTNDLKGFSTIHREFNDVLYSMSRKPRLREILSRYNDYIENSQLISMRLFGRGPQILVEHRHIVAAIAEQNPDLAEKVTRLHVSNAARAFFAASGAQ